MAKKNNKPSWESLTWWNPRQQYKRKHKGQTLYLKGDESGERNRTNHDAALEEFIARRKEIDGASQTAASKAYIHAAKRREQYASVNPDPTSAAQMLREAAELRRKAEDPEAPYPDQWDRDPIAGGSEASKWVWMDRLNRAETTKQANSDVAFHVAQFLARKHAQADNGQRSYDRADALRIFLEKFVEWYGAGRAIEEIDAATLEAYHTHLMGLDYSAKYKKELFQALKQFIRNRAELGLMGLPGNIESKDLIFRVEIAAVQPMPMGSLRKLLASSSDRTKLYFLLMINCGMYGTDIASLKRSEVDLKKGTIKRQRSKTAHHTNAPTITYPLWDETLELLRAEMNKRGELALTNSKGDCLIKKWRDQESGKMKKTDNIHSAVSRTYRKLGNKQPKLPPKTIRKTGASWMAEHYDLSMATDYLADVPSGIAAKHYIKPSRTKFAQAIEAMGKEVLR